MSVVVAVVGPFPQPCLTSLTSLTTGQRAESGANGLRATKWLKNLRSGNTGPLLLLSTLPGRSDHGSRRESAAHHTCVNFVASERQHVRDLHLCLMLSASSKILISPTIPTCLYAAVYLFGFVPCNGVDSCPKQHNALFSHEKRDEPDPLVRNFLFRILSSKFEEYCGPSSIKS